MELLFKSITENGIAIGCLLGLLYYIYYDKKQSNEYIKTLTDTQKDMVSALNANTQTMEKLNLRIENIEKKLYNLKEVN